MSRRTEIQVGVTVIGALVVTLWGVTWLREFSLGRQVHVWHVRFPQTGGLGASDEVQVNGIRKGSVAKIDLQGDHVIVDLALASDIHLTRNCNVAIRNVGLMGEKVIAVDLATTGPAYTQADTIQGIFELGMGEVMAGMGSSMGSMQAVVKSLDQMVMRLDKNGDVDKTVVNLRETSEQLSALLKENRALLHETAVNAAATSRATKTLIADRQEQYVRLLDSVERSTKNIEQLSSRLDSLRATAQSIGNKVDHGDGSIARALNDKGMYEETKGTLKAMKELLEDLKKNPRRYINVHVF